MENSKFQILGRNYGGFDYQAYLKSEKIYGSIFAKKAIKKEKQVDIYKMSNDARNSIIKQAKEILPDNTSGLLIGILLGETKDVSEDVVENFRLSSLSHLLAVSGMHTMYIMLGVTYLLDRFRISGKASIISIILVLIAFMFITGFRCNCCKSVYYGHNNGIIKAVL